MMSTIRPIRWGLVVAAALLTEISVIAIFFLLLLGATLAGAPEIASPLSPLDYADALVSSFVMVFIFTLWLGKRIESSFVLHGVLVGVVATLLFVALSFGMSGTLAEPALYWVAHGLKILGGATGGLVAARRYPRHVGVLCCAVAMSATHVACAGDLPLPQPGGESPRPPVRMPSQEESVDALFLKVQSIVGVVPVECGRHHLGRAGTSELEQSLKCGMDAARANRSFWTFNQLHGIDSWVAEGLVGADISRATLTVSPCARPSVVSLMIDGSARFSCADRVTVERR